MILIGPDATQVILSNNYGSGGDNFTNTWFDDEAATLISAGAAPFTGSFRPDAALTAFDGKTANGVWTLKVVDSVGVDTGSITGWSLRLLFPAESCAPGEVAANGGLVWTSGSKTALQWPAESVSTSYRVYRGQGASSLPNLLTGSMTPACALPRNQQRHRTHRTPPPTTSTGTW